MSIHYIYIFIVIALDESIFLDVLQFPMKNIMSRDLEATPKGGATSKTHPVTLFVYSCCRDVGRVSHDVRRESLTFWLFQN